MNDVSSDRNPVEELAEDFVARYRRGEQPALSEYTARRPDLSEQIRDLFPALVMMEDVRPVEGEPTDARDPAPILDQVGDFRIIREIGRGGMGIVYEAEQVSLGRHVALKVLPASALLDPRKLQRFRREAKAAAGLHHTNIVPVHGMGSHDDVHFIVMQFIPGHGLDEILAELKRLRGASARPPRDTGKRDVANITQSLLAGTFSGPVQAPAAATPGDLSTLHLSANSASALSDTGRGFWQSAARVCMQAAEALDFAHRHGLLHRDVKPSNLLLDSSGTVWVTDFGLAKNAGDEEDLTESGDVVGTVRYLAPERFRGQADARSDVYSLGLTLYELLTLEPAFAETDRDRLLHRVAHEEPPRHRKRNPAIPRDLETIVLKAIAPEPKRRYATAADFAADLRRFLEDKPIQARRAGLSERMVKWTRRRPAVAALLALVMVSTLGGVGGVVWKWRDAVAALEREQTALGKAERARVFANREAERARKEAQAAREVADVLTGIFEHSDALGLSGYLLNAKVERGGEQLLTGPERQGVNMMLALLDSGAEKVRRDLQGKPAIQAKLLETLGAVYLSMGELDEADDLLRASLDSRRRVAPVDSHDAARALASLGIIRFRPRPA